jgi:hypothetical protein
VNRDRGDPRRIAFLALLVIAAAAWAWHRRDDGGADVLRFVAGVGAGSMLAAAIRSADGVLARHWEVGQRSRVSAAGAAAGPVIGVLAAAVLARSGALEGHGDVLLAGGFAGVLLGVGVLYPIR